MGNAGKIKTLITDAVWRADLMQLPRWRAAAVGGLRISWAVLRDVAEGQISLRAMSLVYTTLLSMVPLLAISFSVLKGFNQQYEIESFLLEILAPLGNTGIDIASRISGFVENIKAGVLGSIGLGLLVYTVISLMQKIERVFNFIWHVPRQRPFAQRFSGYLSVIMIGPVLVFSSLGITASLTSTSVVVALTSIEPFGTLIRFAGTLLPYLLVVGAFTFIYLIMPNTRVRVSAAFVGAAVAGLLWNTAGWAFASFVVSSTQYTAIYSAFAALIIFMIWLYVSWLILLIGANIAFYYQHPEYLMPQRGGLQLSIRTRERLVLAAAAAIAADFYRGHRAPGTDDIALRLHIPATAVERVLTPLAEGGLLTQSGDDPPGWLPARPPETVSVKALLDMVRAEGESAAMHIGQSPADAAIDDAMARLDAAIGDAFEGWTLKQLAQSGGEPDAERDAAVAAAPQRIRAER